MNRKKNVLFVNESAACTYSGFAKIGREIISRLYNTGKYNITEIANYSKTSDPRQLSVPWNVVGSIPEDNDENGHRGYNSVITAQFGSNIFTNVALRTKADITISWVDPWMYEWILKDVFKDKFKHVQMACVDSKVQSPQWLIDYLNCDYLTAYSEFGKKVLEEESGGKIKIKEVINPGVNHEIFKPLDRAKIREEWGIPQEWNIIGTTMRSQPRKLYPDLFRDFAKLIKYAIEKGNEKVANNTYLYLQVGIVDVGWDFQKYLKMYGVSHRVLFSYACQNCGYFQPRFYSTEVCECPNCRAIAMTSPSTGTGVSEETLAKIYNIMNAYTQYSICEGFGMGISEAKSCEVPSFAPDYSASADQVNVEGCFPIKIKTYFFESDFQATGQIRSYPDGDDFVRKMYDFLSLPDSVKERYGKLCREDIIRNYTFDRSAKLFEQIIDSIEVPEEPLWNDPKPNFAPNVQEIPQFRSYTDMVDWAIDNILGKPELKNSYWKNDLVKSLNVGIAIGRGGKEPMNPDIFINMVKQMAEKQNFWERQRLAMLNPNKSNDAIFETV